MRAVIGLAFGLLFAAADLARADAPAPPPADVHALADQFFTEVKDGHAADAFRSAMVGYAPVIDEKSVNTAGTRVEEQLRRFGPVIDWSLISTTTVAPAYVEQVYMVRCALAPMFFRLNFYTAGSKWRIIDIVFNTNAEQAGYRPPPAGAGR